MIKVYELDLGIKYGNSPEDTQIEINEFMAKENIALEDIISISWKNPNKLNLFVKNKIKNV